MAALHAIAFHQPRSFKNLISISAIRRKMCASNFEAHTSTVPDTAQSKRVVVGMSGGVDSAVAALLLKQRGYDVIAVHMKNWDAKDELGGDKGVCPAEEDWASVRTSCERLGIRSERVELAQEYWHRVFQPTLGELAAGRTPNPDVLCNRELKFDALLGLARSRFHADLVATGHYARCTRTQLLSAADVAKDQTYFLAALRPTLLPHLLFPVGELLKPAVRALAAQHGLEHVAQRRSSAGICFIGRRHFPDFVQQYLEPRPGPVRIAPGGATLTSHRGLFLHTLGQRLRLGGAAQPWIVCAKDVARNELWVCAGSEHPMLQSAWFSVGPLQLVSEPLWPERDGELRGRARVRHQQPLFDVRLLRTGGAEGPGYRVEVLGEPQRAVTPGQAFVLYQDRVCLGAAKILTTAAEQAVLRMCGSPAAAAAGGRQLIFDSRSH